jgi:hypothetical protein
MEYSIGAQVAFSFSGKHNAIRGAYEIHLPPVHGAIASLNEKPFTHTQEIRLP